MEEETKFTRSYTLKTAEGCVVTLNKYISGLAVAALQGKKSVLITLLQKGKLFDSSTAEYHPEMIEESQSLSMAHDIQKILYGIKSWEMNENAFIQETPNFDLNEGNIQMLRHEVHAEINDLIDKLQTEFSSEPSVSSKKNSTQPSTGSPTVASPVSISTKRSSRTSTKT